MKKQAIWETEMRRPTLVVAVTIGLALLLAVPAVGMATLGDAESDEQAASNETVPNETAPGERFAGVVGVQQSEIEAGIEHRSFEIRLMQATSQDEQAETVSDRITDVETRIAELEKRKQTLEKRREAGEIGEGRYRAEVARIAAQIEALKTLADQSQRAVRKLPAELLEQRGINMTAVQTLRERADKLSGREVREIAREIGGPPDELGPPISRAISLTSRPDSLSARSLSV